MIDMINHINHKNHIKITVQTSIIIAPQTRLPQAQPLSAYPCKYRKY
jgi:hypothetical protein